MLHRSFMAALDNVGGKGWPATFHRRAGAWVLLLAVLVLLLPPLGGGTGALAAPPPQPTVTAAVYGQPLLAVSAATPDVVAGVAAGVTGTLRDAAGDPVPYATVDLSTSAGTVQPATVTTDVYGKFNSVFDAPAVASGMATVTAVSGTSVGSATFAVTAGPAPGVSLDLAQAVTTAGGSVTVSGSVYRADGTPAGNVAVDLSASAGTPVSTAAQTGAGGAYVFTFVPPSVPGPVLLQVSAPGVGASATSVLVLAAAAPTGTSAAFSLGGGGAVAGGAGTSTPDVTATASGGAGALAVAEYGGTVPSGASGLPGATLYFTAGVSAGSTFTSVALQSCGSSGTLSWWSNGGWTPVTPTGQVGSCMEAGPFASGGNASPAVADFASGPLFAVGGVGGTATVDPAQSTVSASPTSVPDTGTSTATVTVTLLDSQGNPVSGKSVSLALSSGASSAISAASGASNTSGVVTFTVADTVSETVTYTATDATDGIPLQQTATVAFAPPSSASPAQSTVSASPTAVPDNGTSTATVTVTLLDSQGNPVSGKSVSLSQSSGASSLISAASGASDTSGVVTFTVTDTVSETVTYTATDTTDGIPLQQTATVAFAPPSSLPVDAAQSTVYASPSSVPDDGATPATIEVTLLDSQGSPVSGKTVTLTQSSGASSAISPASGVSDSSGMVTFTVTDAVPETVTYTAADTTDGITLPQTATVDFVAAVTTTAAPVVTSISPTSGPAAGGTTVTITGSGFTNAYAAYFGAVAATSFDPISDSQITAVSPAGTAGDTVDVTVDTGNGTSATSAADQFTYGGTAATASTTVTSAGGTLATTDGAFTMTVAAGALAAGQTLALTESCAAPSATPTGFVAASCVFTMSGGALATPQTATLAYQASALAGLPADRISVYAQTASGGWSFLPTAIDTTAGTASAALPGPGTYVALAATTQFTDVGASYWAAPDIDTLVAAGVATGYPDGTFDPSGALTRAEFVKMLALTLRLPTATAGPDFADVPTSSWFAPFVAEAATAGLVKGVTATEFDPNAPLTRQDAAVTIARALQLTGGAALTFADAGQVASWAQSGVRAAVAAGYLAGFPDGMLRPLQPITRAQAAKVLAAVIDHDAP